MTPRSAPYLVHTFCSTLPVRTMHRGLHEAELHTSAGLTVATARWALLVTSRQAPWRRASQKRSGSTSRERPILAIYTFWFAPDWFAGDGGWLGADSDHPRECVTPRGGLGRTSGRDIQPRAPRHCDLTTSGRPGRLQLIRGTGSGAHSLHGSTRRRIAERVSGEMRTLHLRWSKHTRTAMRPFLPHSAERSR